MFVAPLTVLYKGFCLYRQLLSRKKPWNGNSECIHAIIICNKWTKVFQHLTLVDILCMTVMGWERKDEENGRSETKNHKCDYGLSNCLDNRRDRLVAFKPGLRKANFSTRLILMLTWCQFGRVCKSGELICWWDHNVDGWSKSIDAIPVWLL